ncbi:MAG: SDR family NAD(P)-dependent oxidoreductase [Deltaproteobacteria bacterium]|nr:SDR family NAD(P)-dependent oxidoreductase [Deltaproteobacteria bacterium]MBW2151023.1 SDR family NAD(P)-dependent oxidoreductase [Deltaproteobacteria bacterium]
MEEPPVSLKNRVALITGSGRGIGKSIALTFAKHGADVIISSRTDSQLQEVAEKARAYGSRCLTVVADISLDSDVKRLFEQSRKQFGKVDILVNNAGISKEQPFMELSMEDWDQIINVNLKAVVRCTRAVLPEMLRRKQGKIINIASAAGLRGLPGSAAYSASKAAVIALSHSLADEVALSGVQVNVICPGPIRTEMLNQSAVKDFILKNPADLLTPEDVAGAALFLASELSGGMNSQVLTVKAVNRW